jgi:predicted DNA-binding transcriptional regulator AlpA
MQANHPDGGDKVPATGFLRQSQIIPKIVPISSPTLWRWIRDGKFPKPVKLSSRMVGWRCEDVKAWCDSRSVGV